MSQTIPFTLDGQALQAQPGETILKAAQRHGVDIPHLCYSDGLTEAAAAGGPMLGEDRLRAVFAAAAAGPPGETLRSIRRLLHEWTGRDRQDDDVSIVVVKVRLPRDAS